MLGSSAHWPHASLSFHRCPEVFLALPLTAAADMWSLGCVAAVLFLGALLFDGNNDYDIVSTLPALIHLRWTISSIGELLHYLTYTDWQKAVLPEPQVRLDVMLWFQMMQIVQLLGPPPDQLLSAGLTTACYFEKKLDSSVSVWKVKVVLFYLFSKVNPSQPTTYKDSPTGRTWITAKHYKCLNYLYCRQWHNIIKRQGTLQRI